MYKLKEVDLHFFQSADLRKSIFKEEAREILENYKYTSGRTGTSDIVRALEFAFQQGLIIGKSNLSTSKKSSEPNAPLEWIQINNRARSYFAALCREDRPLRLLEGLSRQIDRYMKDENVWFMVFDDIIHHEWEISKKTFNPLIKLGVVEIETIDGNTFLVPTPFGIATFKKAVIDGHVKESW